MQHIKPSIQIHKGEERLFLQYEQCPEVNRIIRQVAGARWSQSKKQWHFSVKREVLLRIIDSIKGVAYIDPSELRQQLAKRKKDKDQSLAKPPPASPANKKALIYLNDDNSNEMRKFLELLKLKAYSSSTIRTYRNEFAQLLQILGEVKVSELQPEHIRRYLVFCMDQGTSEHTVHSRLNALKFYFEQVLGRDRFFWEIPRPKKPLQLPNVVSKEDIVAIINSIPNLKQRTILLLTYGCGLRVSEVVSLRLGDIDSKRMILHIRKAKGKKDRIASISATLLVMLRAYYRKYKPRGWLFEGQTRDEHYSVRSIQMVLQRAKLKAGILRPGGMHGLRHSFATHLLDKGIDVVMIQKLLGHNDIKTTLRYLHVTNRDLTRIISPLEDITVLLKP